MQHATQVALVKKILAHLQKKTTDTADSITRVPVSAYAGSERLARERDELFAGGVLFVGLSSLLPNAGDYLTDDSCGLPVVLVRHADGSLRAFLNVCKHRGTRLAQGRGNTGSAFVCPYHGWSYDTAGKLRGVPSREHFDGFDFDNCTLSQIAVAETLGMIWIRPRGDAQHGIDTDNLLEGLAQDLSSYELPQFSLYASRELKLDINWKLAIDTFLEPYHFSVLHKDTVGPIFYPNLCLFDSFGRNLREVLPRRSLAELSTQPEQDWNLVWHSAIVYVLFPNTVLVMQRDHVEIWRAIPDAVVPGKSVVILDFYIPPGPLTDKARRYWDANLDLTVRTVLEEDFPVNAGAQAGMMSGAQQYVTLGRNEPALAFFERTIADAINQPLNQDEL